ncbi:hypothetical protein BV394_07900 [Brevirhabdus pacifica]|uniref:Uncharacterized protein n=2 Tax=Brevirhabdus pacifica TaxID=1267768 RepID=A0A1U7DI31_9RHOB|nr:hypothetical protein [Brevirhabdus pacifica]APX89646.1 hypothetical protein BV394_07900 [Brevirhabdus pacifica]OWU74245.1 hypothetical protein ATO5_14400 [Loktanella sp. 22II-4b]PJJ85676.1 hypothetical protein CLV77_0202 [Brevirhabdus pacifica]
MSFASSRSLFDQQLELIRIVVAMRHGMAEHLRRRVLPHLDPDARETVQDTADFLDEHDDIAINLLCFVDIALAEMREAIAAGTSEKRVPIPRERLIGTSEAYDVYRVLSPQAEALTAALLPIEELARATSQLVQFAEAVRLSADIVNLT